MTPPPEDYQHERIEEFGIAFTRPSWWNARVLTEHSPTTWLYWDEYTGSFRMTPMPMTMPAFRLDVFLENRFRQTAGAVWRTYGGRRYLYYEQTGSEGSKMHLYLGGEGRLVLACSFAYDPVLLEEELSRDEVEGALEEVDAILASITIDAAAARH